MFENRLRLLLVLFVLAVVGLAVRLIELQVVRADVFRKATDRALTLKPTPLPFVRGSIFDRHGGLLVGDEPCWDIRIEYEMLAADTAGGEALKRQVKRFKRAKRYPDAPTDADIAAALRRDLDAMWRDIARFSPAESPVSVDEMRTRSRDMVERIQRIRRRVEERRGFDSPVAEETQSHTVLDGLSREASIAARETLARYPWVRVEASSARRFQGDVIPLAHVLGRMGRVTAEDIERDPNPSDRLARYLADERIGAGGVEYAAEAVLRGSRGEITVDRDGQVLDLLEAKNGDEVILTIDSVLQRRMYDLLGETVEDTPDCSGGSIVVLEVPSREVLAMVSYPSYDPRSFNAEYARLRDDTVFQPLLFRAVADHYAPGSIVKPLVCLAGLQHGVITVEGREECTGYLFEEYRDRWRCWEMHGTGQRMAHGSIDVAHALAGSCNIYMYRVGDRLGVARLTEAFNRVGLSEYSGLGFREEVSGINPTPEWLHRNQRTPITAGHARNFAIGQGELTVTPLQAANLMACYARGTYRPVTLFRNGVKVAEKRLPGSAEHWSAIRRGIYGVVNDREGTAYKYAHFEHPNYVLCGKTGSATTARRPTAFRIRFRPPGEAEWQVAVVPGRVRRDASDRILQEYPGAEVDAASIEVVDRWPRTPSTDGEYAHAWFAGYLQRLDANGEPDWQSTPRVAFAVLVEYGGSGGRVSGPLAKRVSAELLALYGDDLQIDRSTGSRGRP